MKQHANKLIDSYIVKLPEWSKEICTMLRDAIHEADPFIQEDWKWGQPMFTYEGKHLCFVWAFSKHVNFTFIQGALMDDPYNLFNYGKDNLRSRTIKFTDISQVHEKQIIEYVQEAVTFMKMGIQIKIPQTKDKTVVVPEHIQRVLKEAGLWEKYNEQIYTYRKGYVQWIEDAKHEETKKKRIGMMLKELHEGKEYMGMKR